MTSRKRSARSGLLVLLVWLLFSITSQLTVGAQSFDGKFVQTAQAIVMIRVDFEGAQEFGAGIIFGREKDRLFIATAYHVLHRGVVNPERVLITLRAMPDKPVKATVLRHGNQAEGDLAVLSVEDTANQGIDVCAIPFDRLGVSGKLKQGDAVSLLGNPNGVSWAVPVMPDKVSKLVESEIIFQSTFISSGHSGGGLLDDNADLVGMTTADQPPFGRAISMAVVLRLVKEWGYPVQLRTALTNGWAPLHVAAENGDVATIKNLLADCGNPNVADDRKATPLHYASTHSHLDAMSVLLKAGADLDARDADGDSPLEWAAEKGQIESIKFLVKNGANVNSKNERDRTPLQKAAELGQLEIVKFLVMAGADVNAKDDEGGTALSESVAERHMEVMTFLVSVGSKMSADALYNPVDHGEEDVVRSALKGVSNVNAKLTDPLNYDNTLLHEAARNGQLEIVKLLVAAGADLNPLNHSNRTPLFEAISADHIAVEDFLIRLGGDVEGGERSDRDELLEHLVTHLGEHRTEAIRLIVAAGIDPNPPTRGPAFFTLLSLAIEDGNDVQVVRALVKAGAHVNDEAEGITPLLRAARKGQAATIEVLLEAGAKVEQGGPNATETPLQIAVTEGHLAATKALLRGIVDAERWKREEDAEDFVRTPPPLSIATEKGYVEILKVLLDAGANVNRTSPWESKTPLSIALASRNQAVVELLRAHGAK